MKKSLLILLSLFCFNQNILANSFSIFGGSYDYDDDNTSNLMGLNLHLTQNEFNILKRLKTGKVQIVDKKNHFFSRIHVEDIANILFKSLDNFKNNEIYNICDDKPASQIEVAVYSAKLLKVEKPKSVKLEEVESEMLQNFYKGSKKVDNKKMKAFFKYDLKYPSYKEGLDYIFNNGM